MKKIKLKELKDIFFYSLFNFSKGNIQSEGNCGGWSITFSHNIIIASEDEFVEYCSSNPEEEVKYYEYFN